MTLPIGLERATSAIVSDALDRLGLRRQALDPAIRPLWPGAAVVGRAYPVAIVVDESEPAAPYAGEMEALAALERGDVAVLVAEPQVRAASWGELFSCGAQGRGARGAIVDGFVRDSRQIEALGFPTFARGCSPLDTFARAVVSSHGTEVVSGGIAIRRGDVVVADRDGVVIVPAAAAADVAALVSEKGALEEGAKRDLLSGMAIHEVWKKYGVF